MTSPSAQELLDRLDEWKESQGLDEFHWKRKEAIKAHLNAWKRLRPRRPLNEFEQQWVQYLADDGEDVSAWVK